MVEPLKKSPFFKLNNRNSNFIKRIINYKLQFVLLPN